MAQRGRFEPRSFDLCEQQLHIALLPDTGDMSDGIIASCDDEIFASFDTSQEFGKMRFRF